MTVAAMMWLTAARAQEPNQYVSEAINAEDWFEVERRYDECHGRLTPFVDSLAQCFLHHFFNRPDSALAYYPNLLNNHQAELGGSVPALMWFMADDMTKISDYATAASLITTELPAPSRPLGPRSHPGAQISIAHAHTNTTTRAKRTHQRSHAPALAIYRPPPLDPEPSYQG